MLCREYQGHSRWSRFTDTNDSDAVANSAAFGRRCERQGVCDDSGVYVAKRIVEILEIGIRIKTIFTVHVSSPPNGFSKHPLGAGLDTGNLEIIDSLTGLPAFRSRIQAIDSYPTPTAARRAADIVFATLL
jgi:hypothetical protein